MKVQIPGTAWDWLLLGLGVGAGSSFAEGLFKLLEHWR